MNRKTFFIISIAVFAVGFGVRHHYHAAEIAPNAVVVDVVKVKQGDIPQEVQAVGTLVAANHIQVTPEIAGQVASILFQDGTFVKKGTPLIQLDDAVYKAKLDSAEADRYFTETTYNRMALLAKKGIISRQDMGKVAADLKEKKAVAEESRVMLEKMLLVAPFDGVVGKSMVSPGDHVSVGQVLTSLTDTHHLRVEYNVAENDLALLKLGQPIKITTSAYPNQVFAGHVAYIAPTINTQDRTISVYAEVPNDNQVLTSGLFVNVTQELGLQSNAIIVPATSLMATMDGQQVFKVVNDKVQAVAVLVGQRTANDVEIVKGLMPNDVVVVAGQQKVRDGAEVKIKMTGASA